MSIIFSTNRVYPAPLEYLAINGEDEKVQYFLKESLVLQGEVLDLFVGNGKTVFDDA